MGYLVLLGVHRCQSVFLDVKKKKCVNGVHKSLCLNGQMGVCVCDGKNVSLGRV